MAKGRFTGYGGGGGGGMNINNMMKQAQKMREEMEKLEEDFSSVEFEASAGGGAIKVKASGSKKLISIEIDPAILDPDDVETLQDSLLVAVNEALGKAEQAHADQLGKVTGGLGKFPGL